MPDVLPVAAPTVAVGAATASVRAGLRALLCAQGLEVVEEVDLDLEVAVPDANVVVIEGGASPPPLRALLAWLEGTPAVLLGATRRDLAAMPNGAGGLAVLGPTADGPAISAAAVAAFEGLVVFDPGIETGGGREPNDLSPRELEVLDLLARGYTNKRLAEELAISENTVKFHVSAILAKLGAESRTEAVTVAARRGMIAL